MADTKITVNASGPYIIRGPIELLDGSGAAWKIEQEVVALCRCGHSANKPFCDGSHRTNAFDADTRAPA